MKGVYKSKYNQLSGTDYEEAMRSSRKEYAKVQKRTKRKPYVKSKYFTNDKVFIELFWPHLKQKRKGVQQVRAKLLLAGFDLLRNTTCAPDTHIETGTVLHRFYGKTADGSVFYAVQVKHDQKTGRKDLMSIFPIKDPT